ncbi:DUF3626 domain-containing protein [Kitasatospora sp. NPDC088391]|uniref:DUF3626 domain-containing protein n=1 Tax=Kitasatospora sp. NPDC088391 TaxID=3364074 RepID=UPI0038080A22
MGEPDLRRRLRRRPRRTPPRLRRPRPPPRPQGPALGPPPAPRLPARPLAAPAESPSTPSTRASGRHAESTHRTPQGCDGGPRAGPCGGAPRFGSAHLRLRPDTLHRATFCYPDSFLEPEDFGTAAANHLIALAEADDQDLLDSYIEAQLHGPVRFTEHVDALVLDPCYRGTEIEAAARLLPCPLAWHPGHRLPATDLHRYADYRGPHITALAAILARDGVLDPAAIGAAARSGAHDPQHVKQVWHCLARYGRPAQS